MQCMLVSKIELLATVANWYKCLTIVGKVSTLAIDKDHRFASKYVTVPVCTFLFRWMEENGE